MHAPEKADLTPVGDEVEGQEVARRREATGLDVAKLAREAGISRTTLYEFEQGKTNPHVSTRKKILDALTAAEEESGVQVVPSEAPDVETIEYEVEGLMGVKVVRARGPRADREQLREDVIAIIQAIGRGDSSQLGDE